MVCKGVYMDGHERDDVVDYWNNSFLPALKEFLRSGCQSSKAWR